MPIPAEEVLTYATYAAFRRRVGDSAYWLEGIAAVGRMRAAGMPGVGEKKLIELDAVLSAHSLAWADSVPGRRAPAPDLPGIPTDSGAARPGGPPVRGGSARRNLRSRVVLPIIRLVEDPDCDGAELLGLVRSLESELTALPTKDPTTDSAILARLRDGKSFKEIAQMDGAVTPQAIQLRLRMYLPPWNRYRSLLLAASVAEQAGEVRRRYRAGEELSDICSGPQLSEFGFSAMMIEREFRTKHLTRKDTDIHDVRDPRTLATPAKEYAELDLLGFIRRVGRDSGGPPSVEQYELARNRLATLAEPVTLAAAITIMKRFGYWSEALRNAGYDVEVRGARIDRAWPIERCIDTLSDLVVELDHFPTVAEYDRIYAERTGDLTADEIPSSGTLRDRFAYERDSGRWTAIGQYIVQRLLDSGSW